MELVFRDVQFSFREYARLNFRLLGQHWRRWLLTLVLSGVLVVAVWSRAGEAAGRAPSSPLDFVPVVLPFVLLVVLPYVLWRNWRRSYKAARVLHAPATYRLTETDVQVDTPMQQGRVAWANFTAAHVLPPYAMLMTSRTSGLFLDFRCLEAPATEADFRALLARHGVPVK